MSSHYVYPPTFNRYDIKLPRCTSPLSSTIAPPSYSEVLLEKLQSQQQDNQTTAIITSWEKKLREIRNSVKDAKKQMHKVQNIMQDIQYRCIRLECKNEYLLEHLKQTSELAFSLSNPVHDDANNDDDSLSRMNGSVETLIEEAQKSLTNHFSLKPDPVRLKRARSYPCFTEMNYPENRRKSHHQTTSNGDTLIDFRKKYQKARYFHSQWKLINTMRQLLESVQHTATEAKQSTKVIQQQKVKQTTPATTTHVHIHHHHHHHHIHHHHLSSQSSTSLQTSSNNNMNNNSLINKIKSQTSMTAKNATTSLLQYIGIMPSEDKITPPLKTALNNNDNQPVKYRTMFLATMMILRTFDPKQTPMWTRRGNKLLKRWHQHPTLKRLFPIWLRKAHLVYYLARCFTLK